MQRILVGLLNNLEKQIKADENDALMAEAEAIFNDPDAILAQYEGIEAETAELAFA